MPIEAKSAISRSVKRTGVDSDAAHRIGERDDVVGVRLGNEDDRECIAGKSRQRVLRLQQPRQAMRHGEQNAVAHGHADLLVDLLEAVDVDDEDRRAHVLFHARENQRRLQPVEEQFAVRQAGEIVMHGVVQQAFLGIALVGHVIERADDADHLAVGADDGPRAQPVAEIVAVRRAQAEVLIDAAAPLLENGVEAGAIAVLLEGMQQIEPGGGGALEPAAVEAERRFRLRADVDVVRRNVPVEHDLIGAGERERLALDVADRAVRQPAGGEGVLHHREADQHHDEHQAARRAPERRDRW